MPLHTQDTDYTRVTDLAYIHQLHESNASSTWGSGVVDAEGRVLLAFKSPYHPTGNASVWYCSKKDWIKAIKPSLTEHPKMADYYTQFSVLIPLTPEQTEEVLQLLDESDFRKDPNFLDETFEEGYYDFEKKRDAHGLWIYSEQSADADDAVALIQVLQKRFNLPPIGMEWANSCTRPVLDAYSGGAVWITPDGIDYISTSNWLSQKILTSPEELQ